MSAITYRLFFNRRNGTRFKLKTFQKVKLTRNQSFMLKHEAATVLKALVVWVNPTTTINNPNSSEKPTTYCTIFPQLTRWKEKYVYSGVILTVETLSPKHI